MSVCRSVGEFLENYFTNGEGFKQISFVDKGLYKILFEHAMENKNDKKYQCLLGDIHSTYISGYQDPKLSFEFYVKSANQEYPQAMHNVGLCYYNGKGVIKDYQRAIYWFNKASQLKFYDSLIYLGLCYFKGLGVEVNYDKAFSIFEEAASHNLKEAFYYLGICYRSGVGAPQNLRIAFDYTEKGALLGDVNSMFNVAYSYEHGEGIDRNYELAAEWYLKAANAGSAQAMYNLALFYDEGKGVEQNYSQALFYFAKASQKNFDKAMYRLAVYYENGIGVDKDYGVAFHFFNEGSKLGNKHCLNNLALYYLYGRSCEVDIEKAVHWFEEAAKKGNEQSMYNLASMYEMGTLVRKDDQLAADYYLQATIKGHSKSYYKLAKFFEEGIGVKQNYNEAIANYKKASDLGNGHAQYELGVMYQLGKGVEKDLAEASKWFELAASNNVALAYNNLVMNLDNELIEDDDEEEEIILMPNEPSTDIEVNINMDELVSNEDDNEEPIVSLELNDSDNDTDAGAQVEAESEDIIESNPEDYGFRNSVPLEQISSLVTDNAEYNKLLNEYKNLTSDLSKIIEDIVINQNDIKSIRTNATEENPLSDEDNQKLSSLQSNIDSLEQKRKDIEESITIIEKRFIELEEERIEKERWEAYKLEVAGYFDRLRKKLASNALPLEELNHEDLKLELEYLTKAKELSYPNLDSKISLIQHFINKSSSSLHLSRTNDVFICYCLADKEIQDRIHLMLESRNIGTAWEPSGLDEAIVDDEMLDVIENAKLIIPVISVSALKSDLVRRELVAIFDRLDNTVNPEKLIRPVFVHAEDETEDNNLELEISKFDDRSVFKRLSRLSANMDTSLDYEQIYLDCKHVIDGWMLQEYIEVVKKHFQGYNYSANTVNRSIDTINGFISSNLTFDENYIEKAVYDKKHNPIDATALLAEKRDILIYGSRGIGKSLYLMNMFRSILDQNVFFLSCREMIDDLECEREFNEIFKNNAFDIYFDKLKISQNVFDAYIDGLDKLIIFVDGLDEANAKNKEYLLSSIGQFISKNNKQSIKLIYSSPFASDADLIHKYTKSGVLSYSLDLFNDEDVLKIFDTVNSQYQRYVLSNVIVSDSISREYFISSINKARADIKYNPFLISNIIYSYFVTRRVNTRKIDIMSTIIDLLCDQIRNYSTVGYRYPDYTAPIVIEELLQTIAFENIKGNSRSNHLTSTIEKYYEKKGAKNPQKIASLVFTELKNQMVINKNGITNLSLRDYLVGCYLYNYLFSYDEATNSIILKTDTKLLKDTLNKHFENNDVWSAISVILLSKLDKEIRRISSNSNMDHTNKSYATFDGVLANTIKKKLFDKDALLRIKEMCDNNELNYSEFIKLYY